MQNMTPLFLSLLLINLLSLHLTSADNGLLYSLCSNATNSDSQLIKNLEDELLNSLLSVDTSSSSIYTFHVDGKNFDEKTVGVAPYQISGLVLCRVDVNVFDCMDCLNQTFQYITNQSSYPVEAVIWYDLCLLQYCNDSFQLSSLDQPFLMGNTRNLTAEVFSGWDQSNDSMISSIYSTLHELLTEVADHAAHSDMRFGTGVTSKTMSLQKGHGNNETVFLPVIYSLSQCIPILSQDTCRACLQDLIDKLLESFDGRQGGRIVGVRCNLRYETYSFFSGDSDINLSSLSNTEILLPSPVGQRHLRLHLSSFYLLYLQILVMSHHHHNLLQLAAVKVRNLLYTPSSLPQPHPQPVNTHYFFATLITTN